MYSVGGSVSGLSGSGLQLQNDSGAPLSVSGNGAFTFTTQVGSGSSYAVTIAAQPVNPAQTCVVTNGSGMVGSADVTGVDVSCSTVITSASIAGVTTLGNTVSETMLQLASFMGERLTYLSGHLAASTTESCPIPFTGANGGTATYSFADNDKSGTLTPGDVVTVTLSGCYSPSMADYVGGTMTLKLVAPVHPGSSLSFAATVSLNALQLAGLQITGSVNAEYDTSETLWEVLANVGAAPVQFDYSANGGWHPGDTVSVSNVMVSKIIDYTVPRYQVQLAATFHSQTLQGTFSVSTSEPLAGRLGVYPDSGMEVFKGGPSVLHYAAQYDSNNEPVVVTLDENGTGDFVDQGTSYFWEQGINGFPWWEPRGLSVVYPNSHPSYNTVSLGGWQMALLFTEPAEADARNGILSTGMDVNTPIKLFFSGPVDAASASLIFNTAIYAIPGQVAVPAVLSVDGPIVTVTAQTQLQHGELYRFQSVNPVITTWQAAGNSTSISLNLTTLNNLGANAAPSPGVAAPGQTVQLLSTGSFSTNSTITGYGWAQTGGTAVTLNGASTNTASFVIPATSKSGDAFHFTLTVTDANGETDSVPISVFVLTDLTQPFLYYRAVQTPAVGQEPEDATLESPLNGTITTTLDTTLNLFRFMFSGSGGTSSDELQLGPFATALVPGTYSSSTSPGGNGFFLLSLQSCSSATTWQFTVYEAQAAPDGTAAKFSADFTLSCPGGGGPPPVTGSVRVNSTVPLP
jgi:hypothetical protein